MSDDLYRELILDHFRQPRHHGLLTGEVPVDGANPLCGDELRLTFRWKEGRLEALGWEGKGCSISQASCSMMSEVLVGKTRAEVAQRLADFKHVMLEGGSAADWPEEMEELSALEGVKQYPVRLKCALLAWNTLQESLGGVS